MRAQTSWFNLLQKNSPSKAITMGIRFSTEDRGHRHSICSVITTDISVPSWHRNEMSQRRSLSPDPVHLLVHFSGSLLLASISPPSWRTSLTNRKPTFLFAFWGICCIAMYSTYKQGFSNFNWTSEIPLCVCMCVCLCVHAPSISVMYDCFIPHGL